MDLLLDPSIADAYKSRSQAARRMTEDWATSNLFCPACSSNRVLSELPNTPVRDYTCPECRAGYQLKSQNGVFGRSVHNSAYAPKMAAIEEGRAPHHVIFAILSRNVERDRPVRHSGTFHHPSRHSATEPSRTDGSA